MSDFEIKHFIFQEGNDMFVGMREMVGKYRTQHRETIDRNNLRYNL